MRWPACQNTANFTLMHNTVVHRDYIREPAAGPFCWLCVLYFKTRMAGNIKRQVDEMTVIMI